MQKIPGQSEQSVNSLPDRGAEECSVVSEVDSQEPVPVVTQVSRELKSLKTAALRAVESRERLPQPLFWSLFHARTNEIKVTKERHRTLRRVLFGV